MLFKSNKFFDLKSKKTLVKLIIQKLILMKTCDHTEILKTINQFMSIFLFCFLHVTGKSYHFLRFNYLEMFFCCILKGCVHYMCASLFYKSKQKHFSD